MRGNQFIASVELEKSLTELLCLCLVVEKSFFTTVAVGLMSNGRESVQNLKSPSPGYVKVVIVSHLVFVKCPVDTAV